VKSVLAIIGPLETLSPVPYSGDGDFLRSASLLSFSSIFN